MPESARRRNRPRAVQKISCSVSLTVCAVHLAVQEEPICINTLRSDRDHEVG